jgi:diguanylate cyclase (GGDEF)-like protein
VREGDWTARWGGDEFLVSVWHPEEAGPSAERLLERVAEVLREDSVVLSNGEEALLTFSRGVGRWQPGDDSERLLSKTDEALYRAKAEGGNTVVHAD